MKKYIGQHIFDYVASFRQNVGMGTDTPSAALHVYGTTGVISESPSNAGITIRRNDNVQYSSLLKYHSGNTEKWVAGLSDAGDFTNSTGNEYFIGTAKTSPVFLIDSSNNIGIGITNPSQKLDVSGNLRIGDGGSGSNIDFNSTDRGVIKINNTERVRITSSGNVGIGTDTPDQKLDVQGNIQISSTDTTDGNTIGYLNFHNTTGGASGNHARISAIRDSNSAGQLVFHTKTGGAPHERARISAAGFLGIGLTNPTEKLHVSGNAIITGNLTVSGADAVVIADYILHDGDGNSKFGFPSNDNFKVRLNGSDVFTMSETAMAFTGTVAVGGGSGNGQLDVSRSSGAGVRLQAQASAGVIGTSTNHKLDIKTNDSTRLSISNTGNATFNHDVTVSGDLTVSGTTTTIDTTNLNVEDKNITINYSTGDSSSTADGAGITIQDAVNSSTDATLLWDATDDRFDFSHGIQLPDDTYLHLGTGNDFIIGYDNTNTRSLIKAQQDGHHLEIVQAGDDSDIVFKCDNGSGGTTDYLTIDGGAERIDMFKPVFLDANSTNAASPFKAFEIDFDITGSDTVSGDIEQRGISVSTTTQATGGDTSDEHRVVGILSSTIASGDGDPDDINAFDGVTQLNNSSGVTISNARAVQGQTYANGSAGTYQNTFGGHFQSYVNTAGPTITNMYGVFGVAQLNAAANTTTSFSYGGYFRSDIASSSSGTISSASGVVGEIEIDAGTITNGYGVRSVIDHNGGTLTNAYQFFGGTSGTVSGNSFGIQCSSVDFNYLAGATRLGTTNSSFYTNSENLRVTKNDDAPNTGGAAVVFDCNMSGSDSMTGDATHVNLRLDTDSTYTGGDTTNEHRINNILMTLDVSGDSDLIVGISNQIDVEQSSGTVTTTRGVHNDIDVQNTGGAVTTVEGTNNDIIFNNAGAGDITRATGSFNHIKASSSYDDTITSAQGVWGQVEIQSGSSTITEAIGVRGEVETDSGTVTTANGVYSLIDHNGGTITTGRLFYGNYTGTVGTKFGIKLDADEYNKLSGFLSVGKDFDITSHIKNTLTVYHDGADNDNGILIVRDDSTTADGDLLGVIGFDSADGNVPSSSLEASAYIAAYAAEDHSGGDKGGNLAFGTAPIDQNDDIVSSEHMRITSEGLVGIGTSTPGNKLDVVGDVKVHNTGSGNNATLFIDTVSGGNADSILNFREATVDRASLYWDGGDNDLYLTTTTGDFLINPSGNVGIGVTSPASKLEIQSSGANGLVLGVDSGNATLSSRLFMTNGTGGQGIALINNAGVFQFLTGSTPDSTSGSEKMRLTSGGNLLIGTTTDSGEKLNVSGNSKITGNLTVSTPSTSTGIYAQFINIKGFCTLAANYKYAEDSEDTLAPYEMAEDYGSATISSSTEVNQSKMFRSAGFHVPVACNLNAINMQLTCNNTGNVTIALVEYRPSELAADQVDHPRTVFEEVVVASNDNNNKVKTVAVAVGDIDNTALPAGSHLMIMAKGDSDSIGGKAFISASVEIKW